MSKDKAPTAPSTGMVITGDKLPAHLTQGGKVRGNENVTKDDVVIPRLDVIQGLSPQRDETSPKYIPGAKEGMLFNSLTGELYQKVFFIPVLFNKQYLLWKDRDHGGGLNGVFPDLHEAQEAIKAFPENEQGFYEPTETAQHAVLVMKPDGKLETVMLSMSRTKLKVSRAFNSLVRLAEVDRFAKVYELSTVQETNPKNQKFYNFAIKAVGFATKDHYQFAEKCYAEFSKTNVVMDVSDLTDEAQGNGGGRKDI